jgi:hypothetical protein
LVVVQHLTLQHGEGSTGASTLTGRYSPSANGHDCLALHGWHWNTRSRP